MHAISATCSRSSTAARRRWRRRVLSSTSPWRCARSTVRLLAPVPLPQQMYDCLTFEKHLLQARANKHLVLGEQASSMPGVLSSVFREIPVYYKPNRFSVVGTGVDIVRPRYCQWLDYELEFGVFINRAGKNIP